MSDVVFQVRYLTVVVALAVLVSRNGMRAEADSLAGPQILIRNPGGW